MNDSDQDSEALATIIDDHLPDAESRFNTIDEGHFGKRELARMADLFAEREAVACMHRLSSVIEFLRMRERDPGGKSHPNEPGGYSLAATS